MYVSYTAFQFLYTTPAIDIVDGYGLSNETCRQFQPGAWKVGMCVSDLKL